MKEDEIKKILVIRFRRIGDAVLSSTICTSLKKRFPEAEVHYVLNEHIAPLFLHHPDIDKLITFNDKELNSLPTYIGKIWKIVHETKYDVIIDIRSTVNSMFFAFFSPSTKYKIGRKKTYNKFTYNHRIDDSLYGFRNAVDISLDLLTPLEKDFGLEKDRFFKLAITDEEKVDFKKYMQSKGIDFANPIIICTVASRLQGKALNSERMSQILNRLLEKQPKAQLIFNFNGEMEEKIALEIYEYMNKDKRVFIDIEANSLRDLGAMIANSDFLFGNEGGPRHIAQALDIPSFAIFPANVGKDMWLPNESEMNQGVDLENINMGKRNARTVEIDTTEFDKLIDIDIVWNPLSKMLTKLFTE